MNKIFSKYTQNICSNIQKVLYKKNQPSILNICWENIGFPITFLKEIRKMDEKNDELQNRLSTNDRYLGFDISR